MENKKRGRPVESEARDRSCTFRFTKKERIMLDRLHYQTGMSRSEIIRKGIEEVYKKYISND